MMMGSVDGSWCKEDHERVKEVGAKYKSKKASELFGGRKGHREEAFPGKAGQDRADLSWASKDRVNGQRNTAGLAFYFRKLLHRLYYVVILCLWTVFFYN